MLRGIREKGNGNCPYTVFMTYRRRIYPLYFNLLTFFLPLESVDQVFFNYQSIDEILHSVKLVSCSGPEENVIVSISFRQEVLDIPIFRSYNG